MTCPTLGFRHDLANKFSSDISISPAYLQQGLRTTIYVTVHNSSLFEGSAIITIYWAGLVNQKTLDPLTQIVAINQLTNPIVPGNGSAVFQFDWTPDATVNSDIRDFIQLALFAHVAPAPADGDNPCHPPSGGGDDNYSSLDNAAAKFPFYPIPFGTAVVADQAFAAHAQAEASLVAATLARDAAAEAVAFTRKTVISVVALLGEAAVREGAQVDGVLRVPDHTTGKRTKSSSRRNPVERV